MTIRQFSFEAPFGASFPPLQPVLMAVWNAVAHSGVYAGAGINLVAALLTLPVLVALGRRLAASDAPGIFAAAALAGSPWYLDEVMGGRTIPIAVLLFAVLLLLLHRALTTAVKPGWIAAAAGLAAGLAFETRFDFFFPAIAIGAALAAGRTRTWSRLATRYFAGLAAGVLPWVIYSAIHFGVPLASDQARTAMAVAPLSVLRFVPFPGTLATLRTAPFEWLASKLSGSWLTLDALAIALGASAVPALAAMWAATRTGAQRLPRETAIVLVLAWLALGVQLAAQIAVTAATGVPDVRYWIAFSAFATFTIAVALCNGSEIPHLESAAFLLFLPAQVALLAATGHQPDRLAGIFSLLWPIVIVAFVVSESVLRGSRTLARVGKLASVAVPLVTLALGSALAFRATGTRYRLSADATARTRDANVRIVEGLDGGDPAHARILLAPVPGAPLMGEFGARTGIRNVLKPSAPFGWVDLWLLVRRYGITHATAGDPDIDSRLPLLFAVSRSANGALWKIDGEKPGLVMIDEAHPAASTLKLEAMSLIRNVTGPIDASSMAARPQDEWPYPLLLVPHP